VALDERAVSDYQSFKESVKDPALSAAYFLSKISDEKASFNLVLREINAKLDRIVFLERRVAQLEEMLEKNSVEKAAVAPAPGKGLVADIDLEIIGFVKEKGKAVAQEVADKLGYKGKNAACARLNRLAAAGLLAKKQAGRKVYYLPIA
jgi:GTP-sensing pleiotropic transcriptional regulator CodY